MSSNPIQLIWRPQLSIFHNKPANFAISLHKFYITQNSTFERLEFSFFIHLVTPLAAL